MHSRYGPLEAPIPRPGSCNNFDSPRPLENSEKGLVPLSYSQNSI